MIIFKQFTIIIMFSFIGEVLRALVPFPIPAGIYGILLLFLALERKILKIEDIEEVSSFLWECYGERFYTVRKRLRIADAKALLIKRSEMSLSSVSRTVGFQDKSDFRRAFREETGCSPKLWRENGGSIVRCRISQILEKGRNRFRDSRTNA